MWTPQNYVDSEECLLLTGIEVQYCLGRERRLLPLNTGRGDSKQHGTNPPASKRPFPSGCGVFAAGTYMLLGVLLTLFMVARWALVLARLRWTNPGCMQWHFIRHAGGTLARNRVLPHLERQ
jgi:hypothetical protein